MSIIYSSPQGNHGREQNRKVSSAGDGVNFTYALCVKTRLELPFLGYPAIHCL